jgi:addiction module RelB/DinJ family antitoxin
MAMMNVRLDDTLKKAAEAVMKDLNATPTLCVTLLYKYIAEKGKLPFTVTELINTPEDIYREALKKTASVNSVLLHFSNITAGMNDESNESLSIFTLNAIEETSQYLHANRDFMNEYKGQMKTYQGAEFAVAFVYWDDIIQRLNEARLIIRGIGLEGELHTALKIITRKIEEDVSLLNNFLS